MCRPIRVIHFIKLLEDGKFRGAYFDKKRNRFIYEESWHNIISYYTMTKENADIECAYLILKHGFDCYVESVVVEDTLGECAYKLGESRYE